MGMITVNVANMLQAEKDDVECFLKTNPEYKNYIITSYHDINNMMKTYGWKIGYVMNLRVQ